MLSEQQCQHLFEKKNVNVFKGLRGYYKGSAIKLLSVLTAGAESLRGDSVDLHHSMQVAFRELILLHI